MLFFHCCLVLWCVASRVVFMNKKLEGMLMETQGLWDAVVKQFGIMVRSSHVGYIVFTSWMHMNATTKSLFRVGNSIFF